MTNTLDTADAIEVDVEGYALVNTPMLNISAVSAAGRRPSPSTWVKIPK
jgi:hypothetical protein